MKKALLTLSEVSPAHAAQCRSLIKYIEHDDRTVYIPIAKKLIKYVIKLDLPMNIEQRAILTAAIQQNTESTPLTIQGVLKTYGMSQTMLAARFDIPLRTVQGWCNGTRKMPNYVLKMIDEILAKERQ